MDDTFLEQLLRVFLELPRGDGLLEAAANERRYAPWKALVDQRLEAQGAQVRSLVSDRAQARIQRAEQGREGLRIPATFPRMHASVKRYALVIGRQVQRALQDVETAEARRQRHQAGAAQGPAHRAAMRQVEVARTEVKRWAGVQHAYRPRRGTIAVTLHPLRSDDSAPQTAWEVDHRVQAQAQTLAV